MIVNKTLIFSDIKRCSICNKLKIINDFYEKKCICKDCYNLNSKKYYLSHKDIYKNNVCRQRDEGYYKKYYLSNKEKMRETNRIWRENNKEKWIQMQRKHSYTIPIKIKCEVCKKEIITVYYNQKYCSECKKKIINRKTDLRRRNLKFKILFYNPFNKDEKVHYHHITSEYVIPIPADIHSCYTGFHTRDSNEVLDYIIEQIFPSFELLKESLRKN